MFGGEGVTHVFRACSLNLRPKCWKLCRNRPTMMKIGNFVEYMCLSEFWGRHPPDAIIVLRYFGASLFANLLKIPPSRPKAVCDNHLRSLGVHCSPYWDNFFLSFFFFFVKQTNPVFTTEAHVCCSKLIKKKKEPPRGSKIVQT